MIVIKLLDNGKPEQVDEAKGELNGCTVVYEGLVDMIGVDANRQGGGEKKYGAGYVIIAECH